MRFIWATRGREWGFRFLRDGGVDDPLVTYESAFAGTGDEGSVWQRLDGTVAVRIADPEGRHDRAGRLIHHDFVILPPIPDGAETAESASPLLWSQVSDEYAERWDKPKG